MYLHFQYKSSDMSTFSTNILCMVFPPPMFTIDSAERYVRQIQEIIIWFLASDSYL